MSDIAKYFEALMTVPCTIYRKTKAVSDTGDPVYTENAVFSGKCNLHSTGINNLQFADRIGTKSAYIVCLPLSADCKENDCIKTEKGKFEIIGIREASRKFETIAECVEYE